MPIPKPKKVPDLFDYSSDRDGRGRDGRGQDSHRGRTFHRPDARVFPAATGFGYGCGSSQIGQSQDRSTDMKTRKAIITCAVTGAVTAISPATDATLLAD